MEFGLVERSPTDGKALLDLRVDSAFDGASHGVIVDCAQLWSTGAESRSR
jgi:hypothetical protein